MLNYQKVTKCALHHLSVMHVQASHQNRQSNHIQPEPLMTSFYRGPTETQSYDPCRSVPEQWRRSPAVLPSHQCKWWKPWSIVLKKRSVMAYQIHHIHRRLPMLVTSPGDTCGFLISAIKTSTYWSIWAPWVRLPVHRARGWSLQFCDNWNPDP